MTHENRALKGAEFLDPVDIRRIQKQRWVDQCDYVAQCSAFYARAWARIKPSQDLDALSELPLTDKDGIREDQRLNPPFGSYLASEESRIARVHRTSGTSGVAMNLALSRADALMTATVGARAQSAAGLGPGHRVVHCLNYQLWMGGFSDHTTLEETGAAVVPYGVGHSEGLIRVIRELGINAISCTPSYPAVLERVIAEKFPGLEPAGLGLKLGLFGGEAGLDEPAFRQRLEATWGFAARNANYGVSDVLCNFAAQTGRSDDLHLVALDVLYPELIDPDSGENKPWCEGETGELVLTHLAKECQPLVRFRTGDMIILTGLGTAACGRTAPRFRVVGRCDDMVVVRGLNLFPAMVAGVINRFAELSGEYRIVLDGAPPHDRLPVQAELAPGMAHDVQLARALELELKRQLGASASVTLLEPHSLPRTDGKTRRVFRSMQ
jgi:phenylacetate-CoA ligase